MAGKVAAVVLLAFEVLGLSSLKVPRPADQHAVSPDVCWTTHADYSARQCEEGALGMTLDSLREYVLDDRQITDNLADIKEVDTCNKHVKVFSISEMEKQFPELKTCWLSTYAGKLQYGAQSADCQVDNVDDADVILMPPYWAKECNWPHYGGANCNHKENTFRQGHLCKDQALRAAHQLRLKHNRLVIFNDMSAAKDVIHGLGDLLWAKNSLLTSMSVGNHAISQPPPPVWPRCEACSANKTTECYGAALTDKKYKMTFKGTFFRNKIRKVLADKYHNPDERVVVVDAQTDSAYNYDDLVFNSMFVLILPGDAAFSYRFTEAACSGGVPVLVTDNWVPPFNRSVPFTTYGIQVREASVRDGHLMAELDKYSPTDLEKMRLQARSVCENTLNRVELQGLHMVSEALSML